MKVIEFTESGLLAPLFLLLDAVVLGYRQYLKIKGKSRRGNWTILQFIGLIVGTLSIISGFNAWIYYDSLTCGLLFLVGATNILVVVTQGGRFPLAAVLALGFGINFGYMGSAAVKNKVYLFFQLIGQNIPEVYVGIGLAILYALVAYVLLRLVQDLLVAFSVLLDYWVISLPLICLAAVQVILLGLGSSLQPFFSQLVG